MIESLLLDHSQLIWMSNMLNLISDIGDTDVGGGVESVEFGSITGNKKKLGICESDSVDRYRERR